ncbi:hypothetical protein BH11PSE14_BH11PSE14_11470 [soil metagenome]
MNETISRNWIDAINAHDPAAVRAVLADDFIWELGGSSTQGADVSAEAWRLWFVAFPDFAFEILRVISSAERVVLQLRMRGTHRGEFRFRGTNSMEHALSPTNLGFDLPGCAIHEIEGGKITRLWAYWDTGTLMRQISGPVAAGKSTSGTPTRC